MKNLTIPISLTAFLFVLASVLQVHAATLPSVSVSWKAPTANSDNSAITGPITYNVYKVQTAVTGGTSALPTKIQTGLTTTSALVTASMAVGTQQCFTIAAVVAGVEGDQSAQACVTISTPVPIIVKPGPPTAITAVQVL